MDTIRWESKKSPIRCRRGKCRFWKGWRRPRQMRLRTFLQKSLHRDSWMKFWQKGWKRGRTGSVFSPASWIWPGVRTGPGTGRATGATTGPITWIWWRRIWPSIRNAGKRFCLRRTATATVRRKNASFPAGNGTLRRNRGSGSTISLRTTRTLKGRKTGI